MTERKDEERYVDGLKRLNERGIRIYIDGILSSEEEWSKLMQVSERAEFYMGDFIEQDGVLQEIRFNKVYNNIEKGGKNVGLVSDGRFEKN